MNPPDLSNSYTSTLDMAKYKGYLAAKQGVDRNRCIYVEIHHKQAWWEGYDQYVNENKQM